MKATELMIGDLIQYNGEILRLSEFSRKYGYFGDGHPLNEILISEIDPIPLTPEILKKNGFSGEGYNMRIIGFHTDPIPEVKDGYEVFIWKDMCLEIKHGFTHLKRYTFYVHQLQHCLRLCGIDLEIKI